MKKFLLALLVSGFSFSLFAQRNDNIMILGYHYFPNGPIPIWDFTYGHPDTAAYFSPIDIFNCNSSICDSSGSIQLYSNGIYLINRFQQIVPGSQDFNADTYTINSHASYLPFSQSILILPAPANSNLYSIFHLSGVIYGNNVQAGHLGYSIVDMSQNGGQGQMIQKDSTIINGVLLYSTLNAVKHANGRDWWIIVEEAGTGMFFRALLTPYELQIFSKTGGGYIIPSGFYGESNFSPDGEKYAIAYPDSNKLLVYSFDRCTGILTFDKMISKPYNPNGGNFSGCSYSPNSQILYASDYLNLYQYQGASSNTPTIEISIATIDNVGDPLPAYFVKQSLGPDGKIYISTGNSCAHYHVINNPDQPDTLCNFVQHQQKMINYGSSIPVFPNFRLGPIHGSACDSIYNDVAENFRESNLFVYPNPATGKIFISLHQNVTSSALAALYTIDGKLIFKDNFTESTSINVKELSAGIYFLTINSGNQTLRKKVVVESKE